MGFGALYFDGAINGDRPWDVSISIFGRATNYYATTRGKTSLMFRPLDAKPKDQLAKS
jgi:hypothetical protein